LSVLLTTHTHVSGGVAVGALAFVNVDHLLSYSIHALNIPFLDSGTFTVFAFVAAA